MGNLERVFVVPTGDALGLAEIAAWFLERGCPLRVTQTWDGSYRAAYPVTERFWVFGQGVSPLAAAKEARSMFEAREAAWRLFQGNPRPVLS